MQGSVSHSSSVKNRKSSVSSRSGSTYSEQGDADDKECKKYHWAPESILVKEICSISIGNRYG